VRRFRKFVTAAVGGDAAAPWLPAPGSGKHAQLNDGGGLVNGGSGCRGEILVSREVSRFRSCRQPPVDQSESVLGSDTFDELIHGPPSGKHRDKLKATDCLRQAHPPAAGLPARVDGHGRVARGRGADVAAAITRDQVDHDAAAARGPITRSRGSLCGREWIRGTRPLKGDVRGGRHRGRRAHRIRGRPPHRDPRKAASNLRKHSVTFEEAATVFDDAHALVHPPAGQSAKPFERERRTGAVAHQSFAAAVVAALDAHAGTPRRAGARRLRATRRAPRRARLRRLRRRSARPSPDGLAVGA